MRRTPPGSAVRLLAALSLLSSCAVPPHGDPDVAHTHAAILSASPGLEGIATVFENAPTENGGGYSDFCLGNLDALGTSRRAYMFYQTPSVPTGSVVTRVVLTLTQLRVRGAGGAPASATLELREVTSFWLEGAGASAFASCGGGEDVPGVDWSGAPSNASVASGVETLDAVDGSTVTFDTDIGTDDDQLIADVQGWVDGGTNFGWMLQLAEEMTLDNARVMSPGTLTIEYEAPGGTTCSTDGDCASGSCLADDGEDCETGGGVGCICCDEDLCSGDCESCFAVGSVGTCTPSSGTTPCRAGSCSAGVAISEEACDGVAGTCPAEIMIDCAPATCSGSVCATMCTSGSECDTGFCVDGVCCDSACTGQCEACDGATSGGVCSPVVGPPHGGRGTCAGDGSSCQGVCDGVDTTACTFPDATTECRAPSCAAGVSTEAAFCAGDGTCPPEVDVSCAPSACDGDVCADAADGSIGRDGGTGTTDGGCTCAVGRRRSSFAPLLLLALLLVSIRRRP